MSRFDIGITALFVLAAIAVVAGAAIRISSIANRPCEREFPAIRYIIIKESDEESRARQVEANARNGIITLDTGAMASGGGK